MQKDINQWRNAKVIREAVMWLTAAHGHCHENTQ